MRWMIVFLILLVSSFVYAVEAPRFDVTLEWDANSEPNLGGYKIYYGTQSGVYNTTIDVGNVTTYTIHDLIEGTYYFVATAYNTEDPVLESGYSNEVIGVLEDGTPADPTTLRIKVIVQIEVTQ